MPVEENLRRAQATTTEDRQEENDMSTGTAHLPITGRAHPRVLWGVLAALAALALAVALFATAAVPGSEDTAQTGVIDDMTRSEVIERLERINGFTGAGAATSTATGQAAPYQEATRAQVLEDLYRINGVSPVAPEVPTNVR